MEDRCVTARFVSEDELAAMPLRKLPTVDGPVRIVHVEGFDWSPCGGTHVRASGEVGPIKVTRTERRKDVTRIHFLCGWRALRDYARKHHSIQALVSRFTTSDDEIVLSVERLEAKARELQKALNEAQLELMQYQVPQWISRAEVLGGISVVHLVFDDGDLVWLKEMARRLTEQPGVVALLAARHPAPQFVFARSDDIGLDVASLMRASCAAVGGRGGGRPMWAQGGAPEGASADLAIDQAMVELGRA
jgi:alanyl-tRNA synthetase